MVDTMKLDTSNFDEQILAHEGVALVDFGATWCGPCKTMEPLVDELAKEYDGRARIGKVDIDTAGELAARYGVTAVPTFVVFRAGKVVEQFSGAVPRDVLVKKLESALSGS